jgi:hypothetical protein
MSVPWKSAVELAERMSGDYSPGLGTFEAYAFQRYPDALQHMGRGGRGMRRSMARSGAAKASRAAGTTIALLSLIAPIIGLAAILGDPAGFHRMDASTSVPIGGISFAVAAVTVVVVAILWWRGERSRHPLNLLFGYGTALFAALTWFIMATASAFDGFDGWQAWRIPVAVAGVLGLAFGVLVSVAGGRGTPAPVDAGEQRTLRAAVDAIPADERAMILQDRNAAIAIMVEKGRFSPELGERAMRAELGTLHLLEAELEAQGR